MAVSQVERLMARRQIEAMILADPVEIAFERKAKIPAPGGGWRWGPPTPLEPQQVTLIPFKRRMTEFLIGTEIGSVPNLPYVLVGRWNLDIERYDTFVWKGDKFEVQTIDLKEEIRVAAQVDYFGKTGATDAGV
jgi:hypothetical protein